MVCRRWAVGGAPHECELYSSGAGSTTGGLSRARRLWVTVKSSVKAYIPEDEVEACRGWCTDHIVDPCEVISDEAASKVLGVAASLADSSRR